MERTKVISPGFLMKEHVELSSSSFQMLQMRAERCQLEKAVSTFLGRLAKWAGRRCFMGAIPIPILLQYCFSNTADDRDEDLQKDKYKDTQTQTKTETKCFKDPMYAIIF